MIRCLSKQPVFLVCIDSIVLRRRIRNVRAGISLLPDLAKVSVGIGGGVVESPARGGTRRTGQAVDREVRLIAAVRGGVVAPSHAVARIVSLPDLVAQDIVNAGSFAARVLAIRKAPIRLLELKGSPHETALVVLGVVGIKERGRHVVAGFDAAVGLVVTVAVQ